jgi:hypothetical protein
VDGRLEVQGDANLVRENRASAADDAIVVGSAATRTQVKGNSVTGALENGIDVDAAGTLIRSNTASSAAEPSHR